MTDDWGGSVGDRIVSRPRRPPGNQDPTTGGAIGPPPTTGTSNKTKPDKGLIPKRRSRGMHCRFSRIPGETPKNVLKTPLWLPAMLGTVRDSLDLTSVYNDYMTITAGQFTSPPAGDINARTLRVVDALETLTVYWNAPWLIEHGLNPKSVENTLYKIVGAKRPVEMLMTLRTAKHYGPHIRMDVTLRSIQRELREFEPDTVYFTLGVFEWRDPSVGRRGEGDGRKAGVDLPTRHRLRDTDTLSSLSMEYYGTFKHWRLIRDANGISHKIGGHAIIVYNTRFETGHWIKIPKPGKHHHKGGGQTATEGGVDIRGGSYVTSGTGTGSGGTGGAVAP